MTSNVTSTNTMTSNVTTIKSHDQHSNDRQCHDHLRHDQERYNKQFHHQEDHGKQWGLTSCPAHHDKQQLYQQARESPLDQQPQLHHQQDRYLQHPDISTNRTLSTTIAVYRTHILVEYLPTNVRVKHGTGATTKRSLQIGLIIMVKNVEDKTKKYSLE